MSRNHLKTVFVTGATGFLGRNLVAGLSPVVGLRCLVRQTSSKSARDFLTRHGAQLVFGDICTPAGWTDALEGCSAVIHLAALHGGYDASKREYWQANVRGTENLLRAAEEKGVLRFVYCSTSAVHGPGVNLKEDDALRPRGRYAWSKMKAEQLVRRSTLEWVILRPSVIYGPYDMHMYALFQRPLLRYLLTPSGAVAMSNPVYVEDVVAAIKKALTCPPHDYFLITGPHPILFRQFVVQAARILHAEFSETRIPRQVYLALLKSCNLLSHLLGKPVGLAAHQSHHFIVDNAPLCDKAKRKLRYRPTAVMTGLKKTIAGYRKEGYL